MIEPTSKLIDVCERHGAKLTIMVEMGELWAFEKVENAGFRQHLGYDPAVEIRSQLVEAIGRGHDVQLHLHPHWINGRWIGTRWHLDYAHYQLTDFNHGEIVGILRRGKKDLETLLRPHSQDYKCVGFRAGHWNTQPSDRYLAALRAAGLKSDTSVFKWGYANSSHLTFDYRCAHSNMLAWYAREDDINQPSCGKGILEVPIATELTRFISMLTPRRLWLVREYLREEQRISAAVRSVTGKQDESLGFMRKLPPLLGWHPKKLDFCKLTAGQMLSMVESLMNNYKNQQTSLPIPLVMIGHSKWVGAERSLSTFLERVSKKFSKEVRFSTYREFIRTYDAAVKTKANDRK